MKKEKVIRIRTELVELIERNKIGIETPSQTLERLLGLSDHDSELQVRLNHGKVRDSKYNLDHLKIGDRFFFDIFEGSSESNMFTTHQAIKAGVKRYELKAIREHSFIFMPSGVVVTRIK